MKLQWLLYIVSAAAPLVLSGQAANLTLVPLGAFGQPLKSCNVEGFRGAVVGTGERRDYASEFRGLAGRGIPLGEYEATVRCGESLLHDRVILDSADQLQLIIRRERVLISDHVKPNLVIALAQLGSSAGAWRVELVGLYIRERYTSGFERSSGEAVVTDPEPGSYFVFVESSGGYSCGRQIDLMEFTRKWRFDPSSCSFDLDEFAHLVNRTAAKGSDHWYEEMQLQKERLIQSLRGAADKK